MKFIKTEIPDVILIKPRVFKDNRGLFTEYYQIKKFEEGGITSKFVQDNFVKSIKNTLRGMHFQEKYPGYGLYKKYRVPEGAKVTSQIAPRGAARPRRAAD